MYLTFKNSKFISAVFLLGVAFYPVRVSTVPLTKSNKATPQASVDPVKYLQNFGWLPDSKNISNSSEFQEALKNFQAFGGLNVTGIVDNATLSLMSLPRCGETDNDDADNSNSKAFYGTKRIGVNVSSLKRSKRFALQGTRWRTRSLNYNISKYTKDLPSEEVDTIIENAFKMWENVANLTFTRVREGKVHIDIRFEVRAHGDEEEFDGPGGTTAHAYFPVYGGDIHFDDDEEWTAKSESGMNLFQVATHEIGHTLGLEHSDVKESVMSPFYKKYRQSFHIYPDDVEGIQALYGKRMATICDGPNIDAGTTMDDGFTYLFKGQHVYRLTPEGQVAEGYPKAISIQFKNLPENVDAAFTRSNGASYIFKGNDFWRITNGTVDLGFPKSILEFFPGIPTPIDAALVFSIDENIYFFKGSNYWKFDHTKTPPVAGNYPKLISEWKGIPNNLDAAARVRDTYGNQFTYFFKGDQYWRFNDKSFSVFLSNPPYPKSISTSLFGCKSGYDNK